MAEIRDAKIAVVGGAGFIGSHVVDELLTRPVAEVVVLDDLVRGRVRNLQSALRDERVGALLLLVVGLLKLALPLFPVDALGAPATSTGQMHNLLGNVTFFLFPVAALVLFRALRRRGSRLAPQVAVVLAIATAGVLVANAVGVFGLAQRAYLILCAVWLLLAALAVLRNLRTET